MIIGKEIDGSRVEVVLAKPVDKNDPTRQKKQAANQQPLLANPFLPVSCLLRFSVCRISAQPAMLDAHTYSL